MTYQNDPNRNLNRPVFDDPMEPSPIVEREGWSAGSIILGSLAALALVFGLFFMMSDRNPNVATNERPTVTTPATTTGSGGASRLPNNPNGTTPQKDMNDRVPPATNR